MGVTGKYNLVSIWLMRTALVASAYPSQHLPQTSRAGGSCGGHTRHFSRAELRVPPPLSLSAEEGDTYRAGSRHLPRALAQLSITEEKTLGENSAQSYQRGKRRRRLQPLKGAKSHLRDTDQSDVKAQRPFFFLSLCLW